MVPVLGDGGAQRDRMCWKPSSSFAQGQGKP